MAKRKPKPKEPEQCSTCRFGWAKYEATGVGKCRRYPEGLGKTMTDWCGEYRSKPQEERITETQSP